MNNIDMIGYACGSASNNDDCRLGPNYLLNHPHLFSDLGLKPHWQLMESFYSSKRGLDVLPDVFHSLKHIAEAVIEHGLAPHPTVIVGGDHSMAMGTWTGLMELYRESGPLGLIWIDAHMDAHTPASSLSKNSHGMPLSFLLGLWNHPEFNFSYPKSILKPEHVCLIGVRSYESAEHEHLKDLGVKIYFMDEVARRGVDVILQEAFDIIHPQVKHLGLTIDLDAMDPDDCPGVGYREKPGIILKDLLDFFRQFYFKKWVALEIAEFNPMRDEDDKTAKAIAELINAVYF